MALADAAHGASTLKSFITRSGVGPQASRHPPRLTRRAAEHGLSLRLDEAQAVAACLQAAVRPVDASGVATARAAVYDTHATVSPSA